MLTWLSSVSAAILSFGSIVPFSAWMIRLRSMSAAGAPVPEPAGPVATGMSPGPFRAPPPQGTTSPPTSAAATAASSYLLRHSDSAPPVLPLSPPQLSLHSPFTTAGGRWKRKRRLLYGCLFPWRATLTGIRERRHDASLRTRHCTAVLLQEAALVCSIQQTPPRRSP